MGANPDAGGSYSERRGREIWNSLERMMKICNEEKADILLIAGDLFHRQPLLRELKEVSYLFGTLEHTQVVLIAGNHDYLKRESYYRSFEWPEHVHMILGGEISCVEIPELSLAVYGLSYHAREIRDSRYNHAVPKKRQRYEILLAHGGDEKHIPLNLGKMAALGYDYVALGHIHKPWCEEGKNIAYAGALEPIDKNDTGEHGYILGEITEDGCRLRFIPCAVRKYVHLSVSVEKTMTGHALKERVREEIEKQGIQNIYKVVIEGMRDPDILFDMADMDTYGNIIDLTDETKPAYDFKKLLMKNRNDLLGRYIESLADYDEDSIEYLALCEGVQALMETRRG
ncbi:MAG: DNA repair exonuclease [Dorea sp.]|nr:DNA repair exonuclease [Dorea sp.]